MKERKAKRRGNGDDWIIPSQASGRGRLMTKGASDAQLGEEIDRDAERLYSEDETSLPSNLARAGLVKPKGKKKNAPWLGIISQNYMASAAHRPYSHPDWIIQERGDGVFQFAHKLGKTIKGEYDSGEKMLTTGSLVVFDARKQMEVTFEITKIAGESYSRSTFLVEMHAKE